MIILKNCILFLSDLLIVKNSIVIAEITTHLCRENEKRCVIDIPHKVNDYVDCVVIKQNFWGTNENVPIDFANNYFYIEIEGRTHEATYIFRCVKGNREIYSYMKVELRGMWTCLNIVQNRIFMLNFMY